MKEFSGLITDISAKHARWLMTLKRISRPAGLSYPLLLTMAIILMATTGIYAQDRTGSIDLTGNEARYLLINHDNSGKQLGIEGGAFTIEGWVYMTANNSNDFNFFRLVSGNRVLCLSYKGDGSKNTDQAWYVETKGLPEKGGGNNTWNWWFGYKSGFSAPTFLNQWHHVAFTVDNGSYIRLYIDGKEAKSIRLTHNGSALADLWPANGDGKCEIGGGSINKGIRGKFYASEIRVWDAQLSSSEISKYYDEEVNAAHPHWNDLVRYYHGNESSNTGSDRKFEDRSPSDEYDATVSSSDIGVNTDYTPTIKPPSFNDSFYNIVVNAQTCQSDNIKVTWDDFESSTWDGLSSNNRYETGNNVYYELTKSTGEVIYTGTGNSKTDNSVSAGNTERYKLRTYFTIDGNKVYSDDSKFSNYGSMKTVHNAVSSINATTSNCDASVDLSWSWSGANPPAWTIQRATNSSFSGAVTLTSSLSASARSYTDQTTNIETDYYYRIIASGKDGNNCTVAGTWSSAVTGFASQAPSAPVNLSVDTVGNALSIRWSNINGNNADAYVLKRVKVSDNTESEINISDPGTTSYLDDGVEICETYRYSIGATNECTGSNSPVFSNNTQTGLLGANLSNVIASFSASKGYFGNTVRLEWDINGGLSLVDHFRIERTIAGENNYQLLKIVDNDLIYDDVTAMPGQFYYYRIYGQSTCSDNVVQTNERVDLGFRQPFGIANGHIEYEGGNAVEGVTVNFEKSNGTPIGKSLRFDGVNNYLNTKKYISNLDKEFTLEAWIKTSSNNSYIPLFGKDDNDSRWERGERVVYLSNGKVTLEGHSSSWIWSNTPVNDGQWHHIAIVWKKSNQTRKIYIDGVDDTQSNSNYTGNSTDYNRFQFKIGRTAKGSHQYFDGLMDEIRFWDYARSEEQITQNYNRFISAEQEGLMMYLRCDEGLGDKVYDASNYNEIFNKNDASLINSTTFSDDVPGSALLGVKGITDERGDYVADYIPYSGSGDVFRAVPALGQHAFEPSSRSVFFGEGATVQNDLNFTDISSFTITGIVKYEGTNVPVEGVAIHIDGIQAIGKDSQPVRTDVFGKYEIEVPIGSHYLSAEKEGHTFSVGYFPGLNEHGDIRTEEFTEDLEVNFTDDTKIVVAGRIVGGLVEAGKILGLDRSVNNVGVATIEFQLESWESTGYQNITVQTDAHSGEYRLEMIPERFQIMYAGNEDYEIDPETIPVLDLTNSLTPIIVTEDVLDDSDQYVRTDSAGYHHDLSFTIRVDPYLQVLDAATGEPFSGEKSISFIDQETEGIYTLDLSNGNPFAHDILKMGARYKLKVNLSEQYTNPAHPVLGSFTDEVMVPEAEVTVVSNLSMAAGSITGKTDMEGNYNFEFDAGYPSISADGTENSYTKTMEVYASSGNINVAWNNGVPYRAYILGAKPLEGTDFVTYGPEIPEIVLHDPPGSHSYAWIEKGSTYSRDENWSFSIKDNTGLALENYRGFTSRILTAPVGPITKFDIINTGVNGLNLYKETTIDGGYRETYTFTERIETSSDPNDVGSEADLYIGKAYNAFMSKSRNLKPMKKKFAVDNGLTFIDFAGNTATDDDLVLGFIDGVVMDEGKNETYFIYSQRQIIYEILPDLMALRDNLLITSPNYTSHFPMTSRYWGISNDDEDLTDEALSESNSTDLLNYPSYSIDTEGVKNYEIQDSVFWLNQQMGIWLSVLEQEEADKVNATYVRNLSIDGTAGAITNTISQDIATKYSFKRVNSWKMFSNTAFGTKAAGQGFQVNTNFDTNIGLQTQDAQSITNKVVFGYKIKEDDEGDYYSIDILSPDGTKVYDKSSFVNFMPDKDEWLTENGTGMLLGFGGQARAMGTGARYFIHYALGKSIEEMTAKSVKRANAFVTPVFFATDLIFHTVDIANLGNFQGEVLDKTNGNMTFGITRFGISSPIFSVKGGATRCPYEGGEATSFYLKENADGSRESYELHTATLRREVPVLNVEPAIRKDVPENESATFVLKLQNESESESNMWYNLAVLQSTNPDGATLKVDGISPNRSFLVPYAETVEKTLTISKGRADVFAYDSIGLVLTSSCQADPTSTIGVIGDTVYVSVEFLPECSDVTIANFSDNWIINYEDGDSVQVELEDFDPNLSTLDKISFMYKSLSGQPITEATFFTDPTSVEYEQFSGTKGPIDGNSLSLYWNISGLADRSYQIWARSYCSDGSHTDSPIMTGIIDRSNPQVFGTPQPADGIYEAGDDLKVRFSETIEAGLIRDHHISVRTILNGAEVSHGMSYFFDGITGNMSVDNVAFNKKSFTIEYWAKDQEASPASAMDILDYGLGANLVNIGRDGSDLLFTLGTATLSVTPSFTSEYPATAWHHWAFVYDREAQKMIIYQNGQEQGTLENVIFDPAYFGALNIGNSSYEGNIHEFRIWEDVRSYTEILENMNNTIAGTEAGCYGYWPLNEGHSDLAIDRTASRNGTLTGTWSKLPGGYSWEFDGQHALIAELKNAAIDRETDMTLEFWFKGQHSGVPMTLLSNGYGKTLDSLYNGQDYEMSFETDSQGKVHVISNDFDFMATDIDVLDNQWHHFAFTIDRRSIARSYLDGVLQQTEEAGSFGGFAGANLTIGARVKNRLGMAVTNDQFFTGKIDEIRIWSMERSEEMIESYAHVKVEQDAPGLMSYIPFETYQVNANDTYLMTQTVKDLAGWYNVEEVYDPSGTDSTTHFSDDRAPVGDLRGLQDIPFSFVVNGDELIVTPDVDSYRIEGQILEIVIADIQDLNGNKLLSPASWTAYVQRNQIKWAESAIVLEKHVNESMTFTTSFTNHSGQSYEYELQNLPIWLSAEYTTGVVDPLETIEVQFTVADAVNIGRYEQAISLETGLGFTDQLMVDLTVYGDRPDWKVNEGKFQYSMGLYGQVKVAGEISSDEGDMVAAFAGGEIRGVGHLAYVQSTGTHQVFLTVFSDSLDSDNIAFKIFDASTGRVYSNVTPVVQFEADTIYGSVINPLTLEAGDDVSKTMTLKAGWNWISFNYDDPDLTDINRIFAKTGQTGDQVKGRSEIAQYDAANGWTGTLTGFDRKSLYKVLLTEETEVTLEGVPADPAQEVITLTSGWNHIGFTPQVKMSVAEALVGINPAEGDIIKTRDRFASYHSSLGWVGSLTQMQPGEGYMVHLASVSGDSSFTYPATGAFGSRQEAASEGEILFDTRKAVTSHNLSMIATISGLPADTDHSHNVLQAWSGEELVGFAVAKQVADETVYFLTINGFDEEEIRFVLYDGTSETSLDISEKISYRPDAMLGQVQEPLVLHVEQQAAEETETLIGPNPFTDRLNVTIPVTTAGKVTVRIVDFHGREVVYEVFESDSAGMQQFTLSNGLEKLNSGMYILYLNYEGKTVTSKLLK